MRGGGLNKVEQPGRVLVWWFLVNPEANPAGLDPIILNIPFTCGLIQ